MKIKENKEKIGYLIGGGITTLVNYLVFSGGYMLEIPTVVNNTLAWCVAVVCAYAINTTFVFKIHKSKESLGQFVSLRLITLMIENTLLVLLQLGVGVPLLISKMSVSVITVIGNYVLCKYKIFKEGMKDEREKNIDHSCTVL